MFFFEVYRKNRIRDGDITVSDSKLELQANECLDNLKIFSIFLSINLGEGN